MWPRVEKILRVDRSGRVFLRVFRGLTTFYDHSQTSVLVQLILCYFLLQSIQPAQAEQAEQSANRSTCVQSRCNASKCVNMPKVDSLAASCGKAALDLALIEN